MTAHDDQEKIQAAKSGDLAAFEQLMLRYERAVYSHIFRMVNRREDAEDLTQDTFVKVFKKLKTYDAAYNFKTWLLTVATHTTYDFLRTHRGKRDALIIDDEMSGFETADPHDTYLELEAAGDVARALEHLSPVYRGVIFLYYKEGLTYEEIAHSLGVPVGTVKTHLHRAKDALKKALAYE